MKLGANISGTIKEVQRSVQEALRASERSRRYIFDTARASYLIHLLQPNASLNNEVLQSIFFFLSEREGAADCRGGEIGGNQGRVDHRGPFEILVYFARRRCFGFCLR